MAKLYEVLLRKIGLMKPEEKPKQLAEEEKVYNPIGCKIGGVVKVDVLDFRQHRFIVKEIVEHITRQNGVDHKMVDYHLLSRPIGKEDFRVRLRMLPEPNKRSALTHKAILLTQYDDRAYEEGLHQVVQDDTKKFVINDDKMDTDPNNDDHFEYFRVGDVDTTYTAKQKKLKDEDGDGKVDENEVSKGEIDWWDYSRLTEFDGVETEEFLYVEMDKKNGGWFQIWRGVEVNPERVEVF